jgi:hypothetical protein
LLTPVDGGTVPLGTAGLIAPRPLASRVTVDPGVVLTITVFTPEGAMTPCAENRPRSAVATPTKNGVLVRLPTVTVTFTEGTPAGISNGTCTLSWLGLIKRIGAAIPPIFTEVPPKIRGAIGGKDAIRAPFVRFDP